MGRVMKLQSDVRVALMYICAKNFLTMSQQPLMDPVGVCKKKFAKFCENHSKVSNCAKSLTQAPTTSVRVLNCNARCAKVLSPP